MSERAEPFLNWTFEGIHSRVDGAMRLAAVRKKLPHGIENTRASSDSYLQNCQFVFGLCIRPLCMRRFLVRVCRTILELGYPAA